MALIFPNYVALLQGVRPLVAFAQLEEDAE